ncbi:G2/mitotic-specific cyclin [Gryganskiella cystojenkinii]|nr:G2/mitotic-specific cyclin [Gryganskiella cystojenkinii]
MKIKNNVKTIASKAIKTATTSLLAQQPSSPSPSSAPTPFQSELDSFLARQPDRKIKSLRAPVATKSENSENSKKLREKLQRPASYSGTTSSTTTATTTTTKKDAAPPLVARKKVTKDIRLDPLGKQQRGSESATAPAPVKALSRVVRPNPVFESVPVTIAINSEKSEKSEISKKLREKPRRTVSFSGATSSTANATTTTTKKDAAPPLVVRKAKLKDVRPDPPRKQLQGSATKQNFEKVAARKQEVAQMSKNRTPESIVPVTNEKETSKYEQLQDTNRPEFGSWEDEHAEDIFKHLKEMESKTRPDANYMEAQKDLDWEMRSELLEWLAEVHAKLKLLPEVLFLAVNLLDRFLSSNLVKIDELQMVGATVLFLASKYEAKGSPSVHEYVYMADGAFDDFDLVTAERFVLKALNHQIFYPSPMDFMGRIAQGDSYDIQSITVATYLMEVSLKDHAFLECPPSMLAGAAMCLVRRMIDRPEWDKEQEFYSGYTLDELEPWMERIMDAVEQSRLSGGLIYQKYSTDSFMSAADFVSKRISHLQL